MGDRLKFKIDWAMTVSFWSGVILTMAIWKLYVMPWVEWREMVKVFINTYL